MNQQQNAPQPPAGETRYERCLCREAIERFEDLFCIRGSEAARQHLRNSRVELLKAIRSVIDARIEHLSRSDQQGTTLNVE